MSQELTLSIIKPDAVAKGATGAIISRFQQAGLTVAAMRMVHLSQTQAELFYAIHKERPFFNDLVAFMTQGPIVALVLSGQDAIRKNREIMGATDPKQASAGTIRHDYADSIDANAVHGSDGTDTAPGEIAFFFKETEIFFSEAACEAA